MIRPLHYIIVEDNKLDQLSLLSKANAYSQLKNVAVCNNAEEALTSIEKLKPDIAFLDVDMPGINGIDLLRMIKDRIPVAVFVTSHMEYALESYELAAFDFILKPIKTDRFKVCIDRIVDYLEMKQKANAYTVHFETGTITIKEGHDQVKISLDEITHLESMKDYTKIVTADKKYMTLMPLSNFIKQLPQNQFSQIHRSYAVNRNKVTRIQAHELLLGEIIVPIGKTYKSDIAQWKI